MSISFHTRTHTHKVADYTYIQTLLSYLTSRRTVPNVLLDFKSIGGSDDLTLVHGEGGFRRQLQEMGIVPGWHWKAPSKNKKPGFGDGFDPDDETRKLVDKVLEEDQKVDLKD